MKAKATPFDPAEILKTPEECAWFLTDALETKDPAQIALLAPSPAQRA